MKKMLTRPRALGTGIAMTAALAALTVGLLFARDPAAGSQDSKYIGAGKCKNCHRAEKSGGMFGKWQKMSHAKAYDVLASDEAKKVGKEKGVDDPQKSDKCLKCHVTAFGEPADRLAKKFDPKLGVQCESCHGPGEKHAKDRLTAAGGEEDAGDAEKALTKIPEGEIVGHPGVDSCLKCHNEESPSFKPLCATEIFKEVMHLDPRKKRTDADLAAEKKKWVEALAAKKTGCGGPEKCGKCRKAEGK